MLERTQVVDRKINAKSELGDESGQGRRRDQHCESSQVGGEQYGKNRILLNRSFSGYLVTA
jgi:hypothetical protein